MIQLILFLSSLAFAQMGLVNSIKGKADLIRGEAVSSVKIGVKIYPKDIISTQSGSFVKIITSDKNVFIIQENTQLEVSNYLSADGEKKGSGKLSLKNGALLSEIHQKYEDEGNSFRIHTPSAVAGIRGTEFLTTATAQETTISTFSGQVMMATKEENGKLVSPVSIGAGFQFSGQVGNAGKFMGQPMRIDSVKFDQLKNSAMNGQIKNRPQPTQQPLQPGKPGQPQQPEMKKEKKTQAPGMKRQQMAPPNSAGTFQRKPMNPEGKNENPGQSEDNSQKKKDTKSVGQGRKDAGGMGPGSPNGPGGPNGPSRPGMGSGGPGGPMPGGMMPPPPPPPPPPPGGIIPQ